MNKAAADFRNYGAEACSTVKDFYRLNHAHQTLEFVRAKQAEYLPRAKRAMGVWEALELLETIVDDSDPDTELTQMDHALQTAEAIRRTGQPRWYVATGLIHDLGKVLAAWGEPQWAVVGDTFPVGCAFSDKIVYPEFFALNPDSAHSTYATQYGIYSPHCGLEQVHMSWGHDEYLYHVTKPYLPVEAQYMIRYHSFYAGHREGAYRHLMNARDEEMFTWVRAFNRFDLYSKADDKPDLASLGPYYRDLVAEFFPEPLRW